MDKENKLKKYKKLLNKTDQLCVDKDQNNLLEEKFIERARSIIEETHLIVDSPLEKIAFYYAYRDTFKEMEKERDVNISLELGIIITHLRATTVYLTDAVDYYGDDNGMIQLIQQCFDVIC